MNANRRNFLGRGVAVAAATTAAAVPGKAQEKATKRVLYANGRKPARTPRFNSTVAYGNLIFIAGVGYHQEGDITVHTKAVLDSIKKQLESVGSSMEEGHGIFGFPDAYRGEFGRRSGRSASCFGSQG